MKQVAAWYLVGIDVRRRNEVVSLVGTEANLPAGGRVVDQPVMGAAEENRVVQICQAAVDPREDMVCIRPSWRAIAARKGASAISNVKGAAQGSADESPAAAEVEDLAAAPENDREELRVAGVPAQRAGWQALTGIGDTDARSMG